MLVDMPVDRLREYRPEPEEPADFDAFWKQTLDDAAAARSTPGSSRTPRGSRPSTYKTSPSAGGAGNR